jgi:SagB-type dehydrogenase family enzyme
MSMDPERTASVRLPRPRQDGEVSIERALKSRRSVRGFRPVPLALEDLGQLLWAGQGLSHDGLRTAPSAGALYPLELHVAAANVTALGAGVYRYRPADHALASVTAGDRRADLVTASLGQDWMAQAAAVLVVAAVFARTMSKYGARGSMYVHIEAGHATENMLLQAAALGLGSTVVGAFRDDAVKVAAALGSDEQPLCLVPIGWPEDA